MEKFDELLQKLNKANILQKSYYWQDDLTDELYEDLEFAETMADDLDVEKHRWYELSTSVLKIYNRFLGVKHINQLYSESSSYEDIFWHLQFFEMQEIMAPTYLRKK